MMWRWHPQQNFSFSHRGEYGRQKHVYQSSWRSRLYGAPGMAVPAKEMRLSFFDGLLSNIQVEDNIVKGESYF